MHWTVERAARESSQNDRAASGAKREPTTGELSDATLDHSDQVSFHSILFDEYATQENLTANARARGPEPDASVPQATSAPSSSSERRPDHQ